MKFLAVLLYTITLPLAFAHPLQSNDHLPTGLQKHAALNGTDLEHDVHLMLKRGINPTCVASMSVCLAGFSYQFVFGKTHVPSSWATAWSLCGLSSVASGGCYGAGGTKALPEYGLMMQQMRGTKETSMTCNEVGCTVGDDAPCDPFGCIGCQAFPAPPPGPMGPPRLPNPRCVD